MVSGDRFNLPRKRRRSRLTLVALIDLLLILALLVFTLLQVSRQSLPGAPMPSAEDAPQAATPVLHGP